MFNVKCGYMCFSRWRVGWRSYQRFFAPRSALDATRSWQTFVCKPFTRTSREARMRGVAPLEEQWLQFGVQGGVNGCHACNKSIVRNGYRTLRLLHRCRHWTRWETCKLQHDIQQMPNEEGFSHWRKPKSQAVKTHTRNTRVVLLCHLEMNTLLIRDKMVLHKFKVTAHCCLKNVLLHLEIAGSPNADDEGARTCQKNFGLTMGMEVACNTIRSLWIVTKQRGMV